MDNAVEKKVYFGMSKVVSPEQRYIPGWSDASLISRLNEAMRFGR